MSTSALPDFASISTLSDETLQPNNGIEQGVWSLLQRLADLHLTPEGERLPEADWPTRKAFEDAWEFTTRLPQPLEELPHISLADDGEVNFAWSGGANHIDLGFYGTDTFSYYGRDSDGKEFFGDDISVTSPIPEELVSLLWA